MNGISYEYELIGAIMKQPALMDKVTKELEPRDFNEFICQRVYEIILDLYTSGGQIRYGDIAARIRVLGLTEELGGELTIRTLLTDNIGMPSHHSFYTDKIKSAAFRRRMLQMAQNIMDMAHDDEISDAECAGKMNELLTDISAKKKTRIRHISDIYDEFIVSLDKKETPKSPKTGISDVDARIKGIGSNRLITVAGRPGGGKTTFVVQALHNIGLQNVGPSILFTMEMDEIEIVEKMIADHFSLNYTDVLERRFTDEQRSKFGTDARVKKSNMFVDDTPFIDVDHVMQVSREYKRTHGELGAIGIDYLGLMNRHKAKGETTTEAIGRITQGLKQLARELKCSIFMLAQMNRENERTKGRPVMADLRDSGNIEQDSDMVIFLHKKPDEEQDDPRYTKIEMVIAKGRKTGTGVINLCFSGNLQRISSGAIRYTS